MKINLLAKIALILISVVLANQTLAQPDSEKKSAESQTSAAKGNGNTCPAKPPAPTADTTCYSGSGCLDTEFDYDGLVVTNLSPINLYDTVEKLLVQPDGKIIAVGQVNNGVVGVPDQDWYVARFKTDGSLDDTFGTPDPANPGFRRGYIITKWSTTTDSAWTAALQGDGKIVVGGSGGTAIRWAVARYNSDGTLDETFDGDGKVVIDFAYSSSVNDLAIQSDGKIVIVGAPSISVARLNPNGSLDSDFGLGGKITLNPSKARNGTSGVSDVAIQRIPAVTGEERIVVGGFTDVQISKNSSTRYFALMRFLPNGSTDTAFGTSGLATTSFFGFGDRINDLAVDASNRIVAGGVVNSASSDCGSYVQDFGLARYTENGTLDASFSGDGKVTTDVYGGLEIVGEIVVQSSDGKIIITGPSNSADSSVGDFGSVRYSTDGSRDTSFGILGNGIVTTRGGWAKTVALQADGKILVGGTKNVDRDSDLGIARYFP